MPLTHAAPLIEYTSARLGAAELHRDAGAPLDARIASLAESQHGVVSHGQLRDLGMSASQISRWTTSGRLHRVHPRAYAVGHPALSYAGKIMAALVSLGPGSAAAARCAAVLHGIYDRGRPFVEVVSTRRHRGLDGATLRFTRSLPADELTSFDDVIAITTIARTIVDLAEYLTPHQVAFAIHQARRLRLMRMSELHRILPRYRTRHGFRTLTRAIALFDSGSAGTRSGAEDEFLAMLLDEGLPEPQVNVHVHVGRRKFELDFAWPEIKLNIEIDGGEHDTPWRHELDRQRDELLRAAGWTVIRIPAGFLVAGVEAAMARLAK